MARQPSPVQRVLPFLDPLLGCPRRSGSFLQWSWDSRHVRDDEAHPRETRRPWAPAYGSFASRTEARARADRRWSRTNQGHLGGRPSTVSRWVQSGRLAAGRLPTGELQIEDGVLDEFLALRTASPRSGPDATVELAVAQERIRGLEALVASQRSWLEESEARLQMVLHSASRLTGRAAAACLRQALSTCSVAVCL